MSTEAVTMNEESTLHGVMAEFESLPALIEAIHRARAEGYTAMEAYIPSPNEAVSEALHHRPSPMPLIVLIGGLSGAGLGYYMQYYLLNVAYPLNVGGRPLHSWPYFIPITFECGILLAAFSAVIGMFALNRLPKPYHPVFNVPAFARASQDRFFLCVEADDDDFDRDRLFAFFERIGARNVAEVPY